MLYSSTSENFNALELLVEEHQLIISVLSRLNEFSILLQNASDEDAQKNFAADKQKLTDFVLFLRIFADSHHHAKEEDILFKLMVQNGFSQETGPIAIMLQEHVAGRALVAQLHQYAQSTLSWTKEDRGEIAGAAFSFANLLGAHIQKENQILYPMAEANLEPTVLDEVNQQVLLFQKDCEANGELKLILDLAKSLIRL